MPPASPNTKAPTARSQARTTRPKPAPEPELASSPETEPPPPQLQVGGGTPDDALIVIPKPEPETGEPETGEEAVETIPVFSVNDVTYSMPAKVTAQRALKAIWDLRQNGNIIGGMQIIEDVLGEEALRVLLNAPAVEDVHIIRIVDKITDVIFLRKAGDPLKN